jgi:hypothetical protein
MKNLFIILFTILSAGFLQAQEVKTIELPQPDKNRGMSVMQALSVRASVREWSGKSLSLQDLAEVLWAANGVNREDGRRTASSAMNSQDVDVYAFLPDGVYLYNAQKHLLEPVVTGDYRDLPGKTEAPVTLVLISDISRFSRGTDSLKVSWANIDAGIVSQNISLFCAGTGLKTRPRASFPEMDKIRQILQLKPTQKVILNHPVGYTREQ